MSDAVGPGDLALCVDAAPNDVTGRPVLLVGGETYRVLAVMDFACPCGRSDALLDVGVDFAWRQTRFRLLPSPRPRRRHAASRRPRRRRRCAKPLPRWALDQGGVGLRVEER